MCLTHIVCVLRYVCIIIEKLPSFNNPNLITKIRVKLQVERMRVDDDVELVSPSYKKAQKNIKYKIER